MECFSKEFPIPYIVKINHYTKECEHKIYINTFLDLQVIVVYQLRFPW